MAFTVRLVGTHADEDGMTFTVGIGEQPDGTGRALLFSVLEAADPEDDDCAYAVTDEFQRTSYACVDECHLTDEALEVRFAPDAAALLDLPIGLTRFPLAIDAALREELRAGLTRVLTRVPPFRHNLGIQSG